MQEAYRSGDLYLSFAKLAGDVPEDGTADKFKSERDLYKQCSIHDAVMIHAHVDEIDAAVEMMLDAMAQASKVILNGFDLGVDAQIILYPDRYMDEKRGRETWDMIIGLLEEAESVRAVA